MIDWNLLKPSTQMVVWQLHYAALAFMVGAYIFKIRQLLATPLAVETTPARGSHRRAIGYSYGLPVLPWKTESQRKHWVVYLEFALLHLGVAVAIGVTLVMPWGHQHLAVPAVTHALQVVFGLGTVLGLSRLLRRITRPLVRSISSPDDYFSTALLTTWMFSGFLAAPQTSELWLSVYFAVATILLVYLPFGKISHYVYWFFVRYYAGLHFGHRGVYPIPRLRRT